MVSFVNGVGVVCCCYRVLLLCVVRRGVVICFVFRSVHHVCCAVCFSVALLSVLLVFPADLHEVRILWLKS